VIEPGKQKVAREDRHQNVRVQPRQRRLPSVVETEVLSLPRHPFECRAPPGSRRLSIRDHIAERKATVSPDLSCRKLACVDQPHDGRPGHAKHRRSLSGCQLLRRSQHQRALTIGRGLKHLVQRLRNSRWELNRRAVLSAQPCLMSGPLQCRPRQIPLLHRQCAHDNIISLQTHKTNVLDPSNHMLPDECIRFIRVLERRQSFDENQVLGAASVGGIRPGRISYCASPDGM
jgi:hypothetical protein